MKEIAILIVSAVPSSPVLARNVPFPTKVSSSNPSVVSASKASHLLQCGSPSSKTPVIGPPTNSVSELTKPAAVNMHPLSQHVPEVLFPSLSIKLHGTESFFEL